MTQHPQTLVGRGLGPLGTAGAFPRQEGGRPHPREGIRHPVLNMRMWVTRLERQRAPKDW